MSRLFFILGAVLALWAASAATVPRAAGCAFTVAPTTYEPPENRSAHLLAMELAAFNMLKPNDTYFGIPRVETGLRGGRQVSEVPYVPPILLKATGWIESHIAQSDWNTPFAAVGPALISFDCGHGIMQITSGMTSGDDGGWPSVQQSLVAASYLHNIGRGSAILVDKWNGAPEVRPIAGTDTGGYPAIIENWYFAVWSYNGFTGPGANRSNHPADPDYQWPRTGYSCGALDDGYGHSYGNYPYQELVFGCAGRPPSVAGSQLWTPQSISLPDLDDPQWADPLSLEHFTSSDWYRRMDMPSPQPWHVDPTTRPADSVLPFLLGEPSLSVSRSVVSQLRNEVTISNQGSGILVWRASHDEQWIGVDKQAGVALGPAVPCGAGNPCQRSATLTITVDPAQAPLSGASASVVIQSLTTNEVWEVEVQQGNWQPLPLRGDANCDRTVNSIDALYILQASAGFTVPGKCTLEADVNRDGRADALDAALILQVEAGILDSLPS